MKTLKISLFKTIVFVLIISTLASCRKEEFIEPPDPYELEMLNEEHTAIQFNDDLLLYTNTDNIDTTDNGNIRIRGTLFVENEDYGVIKHISGDFILLQGSDANKATYYTEEHGDLPISKGSFKILDKNGNVRGKFGGFGGYSKFKIPKIGMLREIKILELIGSTIGVKTGDEFPGWPLNPERTYFYLDFTAINESADFNISEWFFKVHRIAIDLLDPYFYSYTEINSEKINALCGFAVSVRGNIPFIVPEDLSFGRVKSFDNGNIYLNTTLDLSLFDPSLHIVIDSSTTVIGFGRADPDAPVNFFKGIDVALVMANYGGFTVAIDKGASTFELNLGEAASSLYKETGDDLEFSYAGRVNGPETMNEIIENITGSSDVEQMLQYIPLNSATGDVLFMGTITGGDWWEYGLGIEAELAGSIMPIALGDGIFYVNPDGMHIQVSPNLPLFDSIGMSGDINFDGSFDFHAWAEADHSYSAGILDLGITFDAHIDLVVNNITDWYFRIDGYFYGEACADFPSHIPDACVSVEIGFGAEVSTEGFEVSVRLGVDGVGFDVSMGFSWGKDGKTVSKDECTIIPIEDVPEGNRYYSDHYLKTHPELNKQIIIH